MLRRRCAFVPAGHLWCAVSVLAMAVCCWPSTLVAGQDMFEDKTNVMTARCRAQCLNKFHADGLNTTCFEGSDCLMCWNTCNLFSNNFKIRDRLCDKQRFCPPGCQESCNFYHSHSELIEATRTDTRFTQPLTEHRGADGTVNIAWSRPEGNDQIDPLVYVLMVQTQPGSLWQQLRQTYYQNVTVLHDVLSWSSSIRLTAYDSNGRIAQTEQTITKPIAAQPPTNGGTVEEPVHAVKQSAQSSDGQLRQGVTLDFISDDYQWIPTLRSLRYSLTSAGGVDVTVTWPRLYYKDETEYEIEWKRIDNSVEITGHLYTHDVVAVLTLWPNSVYQVNVRCFSAVSRRLMAQSKPLIVDTTLRLGDLRPMSDSCPDCTPLEHLAGLAMAVAATAFLMALLLLMARFSHKNKTPDAESGKAPACLPISAFKTPSSSLPHLPPTHKTKPLTIAALVSSTPRCPTNHCDPLNRQERFVSIDQPCPPAASVISI